MKQRLLEFGRRERAVNRKVRLGRPPKKNGRVSHQRRVELRERSAVHVTVRVSRRVPNLRARRRFNVVKAAFVRFCVGRGFRLVHFAVLSNHLHFIVEADDRSALSMGLQKVLHSISRRLNALNVREQGGEIVRAGGAYSAVRGWLGRVFADRYHEHVLKTPTEMRHAVKYVLENACQHYGTEGADAFSSLANGDAVGNATGFLLARECRRYETSG